ncbi:DUF2125 domain-containing protein [Xinfangfangia sp. D13-10-4-6]|uniref:DUF2125 domain-containing protein n=1 Tax=Pseudogemmobacter hezensis TaxID=2737662 RepID=UPI001555FB11|nr:DUF2125 domain-containing protein [Pseudogemmobacter hezensis]NPD15505.1 DUF2125 domain-containing protein [Pseudogemmobacter hezensis]
MAFLRHGFAVPAIVVLMSGSAHAALTADQVWQSWKDGAGLVGLDIKAATEANSGGTLTLNDVTVAPDDIDEPLKISSLTLVENGDGSVTITPGDAIGLKVGDDKAGGTANVEHDALVITAREGENGGIVYDYEANRLSVVYDFVSEGYSFDDTKPAEPNKDNGSVTVEGLKGSYSDTPGTNRVFSLALEAAKLGYAINSDYPGLETSSKAVTDSDDAKLNFEFTLPSTIALADIDTASELKAALEQGLALKLSSSNGESRGTSSEKSMFFSFDMDLTAGPAIAEVLFNKDLFSLTSSGADGMKINVNSEGLPAPVQISLDSAEVKVLSPVMSGETAADYGIVMKLDQLTLNDESWALFDPTAALKREPIDLAVDIDGKAKIDWLAMAIADEQGQEPVIPQPESLNLNQIVLKLAGAALNATGALTFDNSMGMPAPLGEVNIDLTGAEQLIAGLIAIGAISESDAMGARMMMGMFMVAGSEEDSLTSKIEFKEGFSIFANGQQIQ